VEDARVTEPSEIVEVACAFCARDVEYTDTDPIALGIVDRWRRYEERPDHTFYAHRTCFAERLDPEVRESYDEPWDDE
jgi:hypothetical protein